MNETERELLEMFARREADVTGVSTSMDGIVRRTRWRQAGLVLVSIGAVIAVALLPLLGSRLGRGVDSVRPAHEVALPDAPAGFTAAAVPYASIAYPEGWYLLDTSPLLPMGQAQPEALPVGPFLQLANFDPDLPHSPRCMVDPDSLPRDGILLSVGIVSPAESQFQPSEGEWPVALHAVPSNVDPVCTGKSEQASWTTPSGVQYWALATHGPDASDAEVDAMHRAFDTLEFPPDDQPWLSRMAAFQGQGTPRVVLGTTTFGPDVFTFVAYLELGKTLWVGAEASGQGAGATAPHTGSDPQVAVSADLVVVLPQGALLYGTILPEVSSIEARTDAGDVALVNVVPLPPSLGVEDQFVWATIPGGGDGSTIVGYDENGEPIGNPTYAVGAAQVLAQGENDGERWTLTLTHDNTGWGLNFEYGGSGGGGGGFEDLGDRVFYGASSSGPSWNIESGLSTLPQELIGVVTDRAARAEYQLVDGRTLEAALYPVSSGAFGGGAQAYLVFIPPDVLVKAGDMVAFDADGNELGGAYFDFSPVSLFPKVIEESSSEALDAMRDLQLAGAVAGRYYYTNDQSWLGFDPEDAATISDGVTYNTSDTAVPGEVSIRVAGKNALVLATVISGGQVYSACMSDGSASLYGRNDVSDPADCSNGWLNPPG